MVENRILAYLHWGSLEITLTVLLSQKTILIIINYSFNIQFVRSCLKGYTRIWDVYQMLYKNLRCLSHVVQEFEMFITCCTRIWDVYHMLCKNLRCLSHVVQEFEMFITCWYSMFYQFFSTVCPDNIFLLKKLSKRFVENISKIFLILRFGH